MMRLYEEKWSWSLAPQNLRRHTELVLTPGNTVSEISFMMLCIFRWIFCTEDSFFLWHNCFCPREDFCKTSMTPCSSGMVLSFINVLSQLITKSLLFISFCFKIFEVPDEYSRIWEPGMFKLICKFLPHVIIHPITSTAFTIYNLSKSFNKIHLSRPLKKL